MPPEEPKSPPVNIAKGLATYTGLGAAAAAIAPVLIDLLTNESIDPATRHLLIIVGAALVAIVVLARSAQAVAAELARGRYAPSDPLRDA